MKKLLVLGSIGLMTLSLVSCNKETKIDNKEGNDLVNVATEETLKKIENVATGEFIGGTMNAKSISNVDLKIVDATDATKEYQSMKVSNDMDYKVQANMNVSDLRKTPNPDFTNFEMYASVSQTSKTVMGEAENEEVVSFISYQKGDTQKYQENGGDIQSGVLNASDLAEMAATCVAMVDALKDIKKIDIGLIGDITGEKLPSELPPFTVGDMGDLQDKWDAYVNNNMTSAEFINAIVTLLQVGEIDPLMLSVAGSMLDIVKEVNPANYTEYYKLKNNNGTELTTTFNYSTWKTDFAAAFDKKVAENPIPTSPEALTLSMFKQIIVAMLPETFTNKTVIKINKDGYVSAVSTEMAVKGSFSIDLIATVVPDLGTLLPPNSAIVYEMSTSTSVDYTIGNTAVTVETL